MHAFSAGRSARPVPPTRGPSPRRLALGLALGLAAGPGSASSSAGARAGSDGLTPLETGALRWAIQEADAGLLRRDGMSHVLARLGSMEPPLAAEEQRSIERHLKQHAPTARAARELVELRLTWIHDEAEVFTYWWNPALAGPRGLPSRGPTREEARAAAQLARETAAAFGLPEPAGLACYVDPRLPGARVHGPEDLRFGLWVPRPIDRGAIVEAVLAQAGGLPVLRVPLGSLHGACAGDAACREELLARARRTAIASGRLDVLDLLSASTVGAVGDDPAVASSLLVLDLVEREQGLPAIGRWLVATSPGRSREENRRILRQALGAGAWRLDQRVQRELRTWAQAERLGR